MSSPPQRLGRRFAGSYPLSIKRSTVDGAVNKRHGRPRTGWRSCGVVLDTSNRAYCLDCVPEFEAKRTATLVRAAKETLSAMRSSPHDPAQSEEAHRKRIEKAREMSLAARAWEREHGAVPDPAVYEREVLSRMQAMSTRRLVAITGLSEYYYLWKL